MANIIKRELTDEEIELLIEDVKKFSSLIRINKKNWKSYGEVYVVEENGEFMGACGTKVLGDLVKLGPMLILEKGQGKGYGSMVLEHFTNQDWYIYAGTSNPILHKKFERLGFPPVSPLKVPFKVYWHHIMNFIKYTDLEYMKELIRKVGLRRKGKIGRRGKYIFYLRPKTQSNTE